MPEEKTFIGVDIGTSKTAVALITLEKEEGGRSVVFVRELGVLFFDGESSFGGKNKGEILYDFINTLSNGEESLVVLEKTKKVKISKIKDKALRENIIELKEIEKSLLEKVLNEGKMKIVVSRATNKKGFLSYENNREKYLGWRQKFTGFDYPLPKDVELAFQEKVNNKEILLDKHLLSFIEDFPPKIKEDLYDSIGIVYSYVKYPEIFKTYEEEIEENQFSEDWVKELNEELYSVFSKTN